MPLSVTATSVSTLLAPVLTPLIMSLYASSFIKVPMYAMFMSIIKVVIIPIVSGVILNKLFHSFISKIIFLLPLVSSLGILCVLGGVVAVNADIIVTSGIMIFIVCLIHNISGYVIGITIGNLFKLPDTSVRAMAIEIGMQNAGLASNLALAHFTPASALAGAVFGIWHNFTGAIYANYCARKDRKEKELKVGSSI